MSIKFRYKGAGLAPGLVFIYVGGVVLSAFLWVLFVWMMLWVVPWLGFSVPWQ